MSVGEWLGIAGVAGTVLMSVWHSGRWTQKQIDGRVTLTNHESALAAIRSEFADDMQKLRVQGGNDTDRILATMAEDREVSQRWRKEHSEHLREHCRELSEIRGQLGGRIARRRG